MKIYYNENFEIIKREESNVYRGSDLYDKLHVYFPRNIVDKYNTLYPTFSYKRSDNREGGDIAFTQINLEDEEWYEWYDVLPEKALEVNGALQVTITFKVIKNEGDVIAKKTTGKILLTIKDAVVNDADIIYTDEAQNVVLSMNSKIEAIYSTVGANKKDIQDKLDKLNQELLEEINELKVKDEEILNYIDEEILLLQQAMSTQIVNEINKLAEEVAEDLSDEVEKLNSYIENTKNELAAEDNNIRQELSSHISQAQVKIQALETKFAEYASLVYVSENFVDKTTYDNYVKTLQSRFVEIYDYINGKKVMPKAKQDQYGNTIDTYYATVSALNTVKNDIASIRNILTSDDTNLDTLQELVNALKNNSSTIGDIFTLLADKVSKEEFEAFKEEVKNNGSQGTINYDSMVGYEKIGEEITLYGLDSNGNLDKETSLSEEIEPTYSIATYDVVDSSNDTEVPTSKAVKRMIDDYIGTIEALLEGI